MATDAFVQTAVGIQNAYYYSITSSKEPNGSQSSLLLNPTRRGDDPGHYCDTSLTAPTNVATVFTAGAGGSRIDMIRIIQVASTAAAGSSVCSSTTAPPII